VESESLARESLDAALAAAEEAGQPFAVHAVERGLVDPGEMLRAISGRIGVEFADLAEGEGPQPDAISALPSDVAIAEIVLPLRVVDGVLHAAVADPYDEAKLARIAAATGLRVAPVLAHEAALQSALDEVYGPVTPPPVRGKSVVPERTDPKPTPIAADARTGSDAPEFHLNELLTYLLDVGGSDLHLTAGIPPQIRVNGQLRPIDGYAKLLPQPLQRMVYSILTSRQREEFEENLELDMSHPVPGRGRFRVSVFFQRGTIGTVMRAIPNNVSDLGELGLPPVIHELAALPRGLVLVTGATGSGKSTTLAAMIHEINASRSVHIMTIEDPIEFMHQHLKSIVNQREVGSDTQSFALALRHALRQDPDVILVGEMRDLETMATALTAAETGHLVFATLHTQDAPGSVERIIDVFPPHQQQQVRVQLAESLQGVITQQLLPTVLEDRRLPAVEVMVATPGIRNLIREGKAHQIRSAIQSGGRHGMQTMDQALADLVKKGAIDIKLAAERAQHVEELMSLVGGVR